MASSARRLSCGPSLTLPQLVMLTAYPADPATWQRVQVIVPEWLVRVKLAGSGRTYHLPSAHTGRAVSELLETLVILQHGYSDVVCRYFAGGAGYLAPSRWSPVLWVGPDRHDPSAGRLCPELYPTIRFEEPAHGPE